MTKQKQAESGPRGSMEHRWAVILAGGDGKRLMSLTRRLSGDDRPKQFCSILGAETLLDQTVCRVARVVNPERTFSVVTKAHESFYSAYRGGVPGAVLLVQPCNRGTSPAIVYSLVRLQEIDPQAVVGFFPSDHHFSDNEAFSDCVCQAFESAESHSDAVILLGIEPNQPEAEYGWIEPGEPLTARGPGLVFGVRRFWEKPSRAVAIELMRRGCFWNSFIMVGRVSSFLRLVGRTTPNLLRLFEAIVPALFTRDEEGSVHDLYLSIPSSGFSTDVLSVCPGDLGVLCSRTLEWTDVGDVGRAISLMTCEGIGLVPRMGNSPEQETARIATVAG
jgi:mannose-1-phosphate guanylyltransferase